MLVRKAHVTMILVLFMATLSACGPGGIGSKPTPTPLPPVVNVQNAVFTVEQGSIVSKKELSGEITPSKQDELFFRASGFVNRVVAKPGDVVKKGDLLAEMQVDDVMNQLQQAQIDLEVSQASLAKNKTQHELDVAKAQADVYESQKRVQLAEIDFQNAFGTEKDKAQINLDIVKKNLELAQQNLDFLSQSVDMYEDQAVKRNQLAVDRLQGLLTERQITAPYDCIVLNNTIKPGQQVDAFSSVFVVGDPSQLVVRSAYDYDLSTSMSKDMEVSIRLTPSDLAAKTYPDKYLPNFVPVSVTDQTQVKNSANAVAQFFYFSLPANMPKDEIVVGKQVAVVVVLGKKDNALLLPPAAIREYRGLNFVIVQEGATRRRVEINKIGLKGTDRWEVIADLKPGDKVLGP